MPAGPLNGLRVVEIAGIGPGPFCAMMLADAGADVVRVDRPRSAPPEVEDRFHVLNRGRRSICLDLKEPGAAQVVLELAERADIVLEGFRPGVAERLGVGPQDCLDRNPAVVYGRMTGWGQDGPLAQQAGHDINYIAVSGLLHAFGRADGPPQIPLNVVGDFGGGGLLLAFGLLAAVLEARRSGKGQVVDAAILDGSAALGAMLHGFLSAGAMRDERGVNLLDSGAPFYDVYETSDGRHVAVGCLEPQFYAEMTALLGFDEPPDRSPEGWPALRAHLAEKFAAKTRDHWASVFHGTDACVSPVLSLTEARRDEHVRARQGLVEADGVWQPAPAPRFSRTPSVVGPSPRRPGADSADILRSWQIPGADELLRSGLVRQA